MIRQKLSGLMFAVVFAFACSAGFGAHAEDKKADASKDMKAHIEMHEKMANAHKAAADCLKAGKPMDECRADFKKAAGDDMMMMGHHHGHGCSCGDDMKSCGDHEHGCKDCKGCKDGKTCKDCDTCKDCKGCHGDGAGSCSDEGAGAKNAGASKDKKDAKKK